MTITVYFIGGERDTCYSNGTSPLESLNSAFYDSTYSRAAMTFLGGSPASTDYWGAKLIDPSTGAYTTLTTFQSFRFDGLSPNGGVAADTPVIHAVNGSGTVVFRIVRTNTTYKGQFWNGASYTDIIGGSTFTIGGAVKYTLVVDILPGISGTCAIYLNGTLVSSGTINDADCNAIAEWRMMVGDTNRNHSFSQVACASVSLVGSHVYCRPPTGNSATNTAWAGVFSDVDEAVTTDTDLNSSTSVGDKETSTHASITLGGGVTVAAVAIGMRCKNSATGPQNIKTLLRIGSTNYTQSYNVAGINTGFGPCYGIWMQDPSTLASWGSNATSASTEAGYESAT